MIINIQIVTTQKVGFKTKSHCERTFKESNFLLFLSKDTYFKNTLSKFQKEIQRIYRDIVFSMKKPSKSPR